MLSSSLHPRGPGKQGKVGSSNRDPVRLWTFANTVRCHWEKGDVERTSRTVSVSKGGWTAFQETSGTEWKAELNEAYLGAGISHYTHLWLLGRPCLHARFWGMHKDGVSFSVF